MDGRGGCCIARYATGAYDMSKVDRIMLRFRPIAPKPVAGATASDGSSSESGEAFTRTGRAKRNHIKSDNSSSSSNNTRRTRRRKTTSSPRRKTTSSPEQKNPAAAVTLPLLPETPDPKESPARDLTLPAPMEVNNNLNKLNNWNVPMWLSFGNPLGGSYSCVTVECVTDTWVEGEGLGGTDEERKVNLSKDTCPGFVSDGYGRVTWTNSAYREMGGHEGEGEELVMLLGAVVPYPSFTCRVRVVQYKCGKEKSSLAVPCDVWRMDCGGFAWRLDVKAALSLRFGC